MGPTGITYTGSTGPQGAMGPQGPSWGPTGPTGIAGPTGAAVSSSSIVIASYATGAIANAVAASNATVTYVSQTAIPVEAKGKTGVLMAYFDMQTSGAPFISNVAFDYYVAIDGSNLGYGPVQKARYTQTVTNSSNLIGSNGYTIGTGGLSPLYPMTIPVAISSGASMFQIGIANSTHVFGLSAGVAASSNSNSTTGNTTLGYTVPSTANGLPVVGVYIYCWGGGGGSMETQASPGGGGGFVSGYYACAPGTSLAVVGGVKAGYSIATGGSFGWNGGFGGPFSGVFVNSVAVSNTICVAGGGGGGAYGYPSDYVSGGYGGYPNGGAPYSTTYATSSTLVTGGTQTSGGIGPAGGGAIATGGQFRPGQANGQSYAGCGWYGGGSGYYNGKLVDGSGQGGGSGYIGNVNGATGGIGFTSGANYSNGTQATINGPSNAAPGGITNPYYPGALYGYGCNVRDQLGPGVTVIVPMVGTFGPVSVGVDARLVVI